MVICESAVVFGLPKKRFTAFRKRATFPVLSLLEPGAGAMTVLFFILENSMSVVLQSVKLVSLFLLAGTVDRIYVRNVSCSPFYFRSALVQIHLIKQHLGYR